MERQHDNHQHWHELTPDQFAALGVNDVAYVKAKEQDGEQVFAIHTADGNEVGVVSGRELAYVTVRQNDLEPVSVH